MAAVFMCVTWSLAAQDRTAPANAHGWSAPFGTTSIGVAVRDPDASEASRHKLEPGRGVLVTSVVKGGPAERAGVMAGDVFVEFGGERLRSSRQLVRLVRESPAGQPVGFVVVRQGRRITLSVTPEAGAGWSGWPDGIPLPDLSQLEDLPERLRSLYGGSGLTGITLQPLVGDLAAYFGAKSGVLVAAVDPDSPAGRAGLAVGDVITAADGHPVSSIGALRRAVRESNGAVVSLSIVREKKPLTLSVPIQRAREAASAWRSEPRAF